MARYDFWKFIGYDVIEFAKWVLLLANKSYPIMRPCWGNMYQRLYKGGQFCKALAKTEATSVQTSGPQAKLSYNMFVLAISLRPMRYCFLKCPTFKAHISYEALTRETRQPRVRKRL